MNDHIPNRWVKAQLFVPTVDLNFETVARPEAKNEKVLNEL